MNPRGPRSRRQEEYPVRVSSQAGVQALRRGRTTWGRIILAGGILVVIGMVVAIVFGASEARLTPADQSIASVAMPLGGGSISGVDVVTGPNARPVPVPVTVRGQEISATRPIAAGTRLNVQVVINRPGWDAWFAGERQRLSLTVTTPVASLRSHYLTVGPDEPLHLRFKAPIEAYSIGSSPRRLVRHVLTSSQMVVTVRHVGEAGTEFVSAQPRSWETSGASSISWFPRGGSATAVASPSPGSTITANTPIMLTFNKPVAQALGSHLPLVSPAHAGTWHRLSSHAIVVRPEGYGYGLGTRVRVALPSTVHLAGAQADGGSWTVPAGSTVRLQQLLAILGYLPLTFSYAGDESVDDTPAGQEAAAMNPPHGTFRYRYADAPSALREMWQLGASGTMTEGAIMAFEADHDMYEGPGGEVTAGLWRALIAAVIAGTRNTFGYTFVMVSEASPESLSLWHDGTTVLSAIAVNTGVAADPTATGTYPVFEHLPVTTMSGTNADGSHYTDPSIRDVSYFNNGDALHAFTRDQYGFPQSDGCVEMDLGDAAQVYPYTPIGTLVNVS